MGKLSEETKQSLLKRLQELRMEREEVWKVARECKSRPKETIKGICQQMNSIEDMLAGADIDPPEELVVGRLYRVKSRNLKLAVFRGGPKGNCGFIGIRTKFGYQYLFTEYHWDDGAPYGTVQRAIDTGIQVPEGMELKENNPTEDRVTGRPVEFDKPVQNGGKGWYYTDTGYADLSISPVTPMYQPLFNWLKEQEKILAGAEEG